MTAPSSGQIRCPNCGALVTTPGDWRLIQCPECGHPIMRMDTEPGYD